jgi:hypothetical protein
MVGDHWYHLAVHEELIDCVMRLRILLAQSNPKYNNKKGDKTSLKAI